MRGLVMVLEVSVKSLSLPQQLLITFWEAHIFHPVFVYHYLRVLPEFLKYIISFPRTIASHIVNIVSGLLPNLQSSFVEKSFSHEWTVLTNGSLIFNDEYVWWGVLITHVKEQPLHVLSCLLVKMFDFTPLVLSSFRLSNIFSHLGKVVCFAE